ncbi:MAG: UDP-glucose--hexose-1-phosphate uridylyltransferase [Gammaproteobacteria bacterium]|nr:UDP-glucose--hexose-1-phosphate uridylyltransferase [Gammaproteobacteria bacterium]
MNKSKKTSAASFNPEEHSHRRYNPLRAEWVLVSPHRSTRPWQGQQEDSARPAEVMHDAGCYLCPGNQRVNGERNPVYDGPFVFTNDFAALQEEERIQSRTPHSLLLNQPVRGTSRVICYSPHHSRTLPQMSVDSINQLVDCWSQQLIELSATYQWVQIFENKGSVMGCSNPHPHGQIWAMDQLPTEAQKEEQNLLQYHNQYRSNLLLDYVKTEIELDQRIIEKSNEWVALVPYWAIWPFELLLVPINPARHLDDLSAAQKSDLALILKKITSRYDNLFQCSFPYSMGWHGQPFNKETNHHWQLHAHFYPPLLRSATIKKHMVGFEMLAEPQRDITPEQAAEKLRNCDPIHYLETKI